MKETISIKKYREFYVRTAVQKVLELFYKYPEKEFSLSEVAKEAGVAKSNLGQIIENLVKNGFVKVEKLTKIWRIRSDPTNWYFIKGKIVYNLNFVYQSGIIEYLYKKYDHPKSIILFGSFRRGEDMSSSDIDIAVENDEFKEHSIVRLEDLTEFEKEIGRRIQIHKFCRKVVEKGLFNNIANGIVLFGFLEVNP